jgi:hypothetical protein
LKIHCDLKYILSFYLTLGLNFLPKKVLDDCRIYFIDLNSSKCASGGHGW